MEETPKNRNAISMQFFSFSLTHDQIKSGKIKFPKKMLKSIFFHKITFNPGAFYQKFDLRIIFTDSFCTFPFLRRILLSQFSLTNIYFKLKKPKFSAFSLDGLKKFHTEKTFLFHMLHSRFRVFTGIFSFLFYQQTEATRKLQQANF